MKCTATLPALVLATVSTAQVVGNPFFTCPGSFAGGCCLSYNAIGTGVDCGPVIPGPIPGHEKEFVCAFRPGEKQSCCSAGGINPSGCVAAPAFTPLPPVVTITFGKK